MLVIQLCDRLKEVGQVWYSSLASLGGDVDGNDSDWFEEVIVGDRPTSEEDLERVLSLLETLPMPCVHKKHVLLWWCDRAKIKLRREWVTRVCQGVLEGV